MINIRTRLEQGGITITSDEISVPLVAATFTHPALAGQKIIQLVPEPLLEAQELTLGVSGLEAGERTPVGHTRRRAIGFPAWPIINDPDNAAHALNLVADLERATRLARSKPGYAKASIDKLVETLDQTAPHFLPTFLEEAGRLFLAVENRTYAAQMFGKAREAERRHSLRIDEERHREVLLEFAYAGAISAKELTAEAKQLAERATPAEAYDAFATLCVERVRGGLLPYSGMQRDLSRLAKTAGLQPAMQDARVVTELLTAPSIGNAPEHFWKSYDKAIRVAAKDDPSVRALLLDLTPTQRTIAQWLDILEAVGALDRVRSGGDPGFCQRMVDWCQRRAWHQTQPRLVRLLDEALPAAAGGGPVQVNLGNLNQLPADVLDVMIAHGVALELVPGRRRAQRIDLKTWARHEHRRDLAALAKQEAFSTALWAGYMAELGDAEVMTVMVREAGTRGLGLQLLEELADELDAISDPGLATLRTAAGLVTNFRPAPDPDHAPFLARIDARLSATAENIAANLRLGVAAELVWPAWDEARQAMGHGKGRRSHGSRVSWPDMLVYSNDRMARITRDSVEWQPNFSGDYVDSALLAGNDLAVSTSGRLPSGTWGTKIQWASSPQQVQEVAWLSRSLRYGPAGGLNFPVPAGRLCAAGLVRPGERQWIDQDGVMFHDGTDFWAIDNHRPHELDPATGEQGRESVPDWLAEQQRRHADLELVPDRSMLHPVTPGTAASMLSTAGGFHRCAVLSNELRGEDDLHVVLVDADGTDYHFRDRTFEPKLLPQAVLQRPGGGAWLVTNRWLIDSVTGQRVEADSIDVPLVAWHHLRPRDEAVSRRLRRATAKSVAKLVKKVAATPEPKEGPDPLLRDVEKHFRVQSPELAQAIVEILREGYALSLPPGRNDAGRAPVEPEVPGQLVTRHSALFRNVMARAGRQENPVAGLVKAAGVLGIGPHAGNYVWGAGWTQFLGREASLLMLAAVPGRTEAEIRACQEYWTSFRDSGWLGISPSVTAMQMPTQWTTTDEWGALARRGILIAGTGHQPRDSETTYCTVVRKDCQTGPITSSGMTATLQKIQIPAGPRGDVGGLFDELVRTRTDAAEAAETLKTRAETLADLAGMPYAEAGLLLVGCTGFTTFTQNFLPKELRTALGLKVAQAEDARNRLRRHDEHLIGILAAGVPVDNPARLLTEGPDLATMADYWKQHLAGPARSLPPEVLERKPKALNSETIAAVLAEGEESVETIPSPDSWASRVVAALWLAQDLPADSELRPRVATAISRLLAQRTQLAPVEIGSYYDQPRPAQLLGLPAREPQTVGGTLHSGIFTLERDHYYRESVTADLTAITAPEDPNLKLALEIGSVNRNSGVALVAQLVTISGDLDDFPEALRQGWTGDAHDPLAVAPGLVAEVAAALPVSEDAARYYLQLLALAEPTDAGVRRWNEWQTARIKAAGAELVSAGVVIEATRPRAGRSFFLPGGWAEAEAPTLPLETWKLDTFWMVRGEGRSKYSPGLRLTVATRPPIQLFTEAWQRSRSDDGPGFDELQTTRRRRR